MEVTERQAGSVHVLRHSFRASESLAVALERYLKPGVTVPRSFLYATRTVIVDFNKHSIHDVNIDIDAANSDFLRHSREKIEIGGYNNEEQRRSVVVAELASKALRVGVFPQKPADFKTLLAPFDAIPNDSPKLPSPSMRHFLYTDIPAGAVGDETDITNATSLLDRALSDPLTRGFYTVRPSGVDRQPLR